MAKASKQAPVKMDADSKAAPKLHLKGHEIQAWGHIVKMPNALTASVCSQSVELLNQMLADTMTMRDLYKKHHWQVSGPTFNQLHLLYDKHFEEQVLLVDTLAERIQILGGIAVAMAADVADMTVIPRPPKGREAAPMQISRLLEAHEMVILAARSNAKKVDGIGDLGSADILVSNVLRTNELQAWFLSEHLVAAPSPRG
jgi:starvation-inducible DNA-binding protein